MCPGLVATNLVDMGPMRPIMEIATRMPLVNTPDQGERRLVVRLAADPKLEGVTGRFYTTTPGMRMLPPVPPCSTPTSNDASGNGPNDSSG